MVGVGVDLGVRIRVRRGLCLESGRDVCEGSGLGVGIGLRLFWMVRLELGLG